jgi:hypothetical protein
MYGTLMRARVKPGNRDALVGAMSEGGSAKGFKVTYVLFPDEHESEVVAAVIFDDEDSYRANAHDPATEEWYGRFRALLEDDPEWSDGTWFATA